VQPALWLKGERGCQQSHGRWLIIVVMERKGEWEEAGGAAKMCLLELWGNGTSQVEVPKAKGLPHEHTEKGWQWRQLKQEGHGFCKH